MYCAQIHRARNYTEVPLSRKAFTLIELLVVIAIIAILAAILFPVFAQAKQAAKAASSLSNEKQTALAVIMYAGDVDDTAPIDVLWGTSDAVYWYGSAGSQFSPWSYEIMPYTKNGNIFQDPQVQPNGPATAGVALSSYYAYNPQYGYNYTALSPITSTSGTGANKWVRTPSAFTSISRPAETVMISSKSINSETSGWWWGAGTLVAGSFTVEAPDCYDIAPLCVDNWGTGWWATNALHDKTVAGSNSLFNSQRKAGASIVGFVDGHVKTMQPGNLAAGTNWNPKQDSSQLVMKNSSAYLWGNFN